jgi:hypothetical protein
VLKWWDWDPEKIKANLPFILPKASWKKCLNTKKTLLCLEADML